MMDVSSIAAAAGGVPTIGIDQPTAPENPAGASAFAQQLGGVVDGLQQSLGASDELAVKAVIGDLQDIHQATIAASRAQLEVELVSAVRNKAVDAFNEIMRMQA